MSSTRNGGKDSSTAESTTLIFIAGLILGVSVTLAAYLVVMIILICIGLTLFGFGIYSGNRSNQKLKERLDNLEKFFGINTLELTDNNIKKQNDLDGQHTKLQSYTLISATAIIAVFTIALVVITIYQYNIENFEPVVDMNNGMITVIPGFYPFYNNTDGISISAITNHNLRFTVVNASMYYINDQYAKCFFAKLPTIRSFDHTSIMFGKNADVKTLVPEVNLDYTVNSTFLYLPHIPNTSGGYELGTLKFDILMEDLQDESKNRMKEGYSDIVVKLPYERYHELISNCTLAHKQ